MSAPHARFAARAASLRDETRRRRLLLAGVAVLVVALVWLVVFSPVLTVRTVQVTGAPAALTDRVRAVADDVVGTPVVRADTSAVQRRVAKIDGVRAVRVDRSFPRGLRVTVTPRTPVLVIEQAGTRRLVDTEGVAYARGAKAPRGLPVVKVAGEEPPGRPELSSLATVLSALPAQERARVSGLQLSSAGQVSFRLGDLAVSWGDATGSSAKARDLAALRPTIEDEGATSIDLSAPGRPVLS
ncbi:cell division protein FtsQ/DivIB [Barrientosiimonas humi]|uniref:cell division protein FtsQ/DivIB n=1 Tax=Barrientosiimonas humi TaxID=999931 RepID=UPI00370D7373